MSHPRTNLWYSSVKMFKKNNERIDEVSDPLYFLKDQTLHYINMHFFFQKWSFTKKKKKVFLNFFYWLFVNYLFVCIYIYIHTHTHTHIWLFNF